MDVDLVMPQLGESITEGTVSEWLKKEGDEVHRDEAIVAVSTDKADVEVPSPIAGVLSKILVQAGQTVEVGARIAVISAEKAKRSIAMELPRVEARLVTTPPPRREEAKEPEAVSPLRPAPPPAAFTPAGAAKTLQAATGLPRLTPIVLRLILEHELDPKEIKGTGASGRITREDVLRHISERGVERKPEPPLPSESPPKPQKAPAMPEPKPAEEKPQQQPLAEGDEEVKLSPMRRRIAERLVRSKTEAPHVTTMLDVDMTKVVALRAKHRDAYEKDGLKLTYMAFILKAVADALKAIPMVNASWAGDRIIIHHAVHVGMAVSVEKGLAVPVIRDTDQKSIRELAEIVQGLAQRARAGRLSTDELQGGTFTVTNPGSFGGMLSTPIINPPEAAILAVERIAEQPVVRDGGLAIASMMNLCLSYDHRVIDGETAIGFLQQVRKALEAAAFEV